MKFLDENKSFAQELKDIEELKKFARENPDFNFTVNMASGAKISHFENP